MYVCMYVYAIYIYVHIWFRFWGIGFRGGAQEDKSMDNKIRTRVLAAHREWAGQAHYEARLLSTMVLIRTGYKT